MQPDFYQLTGKKSGHLGSLFMVGVPGLDLDESTRQLIADYGIHNFIIFRRNVRSKSQLAELCGDLHDFCKKNNLPAPLIAIDHEGGTVCRLPESFTTIPPARKLGDASDPEKIIRKYVAITIRELQEVGINMNLAPVLDVCPKGKGFFMESRSLGEDAEKVAGLGSLIVRLNQERGMAVCGKHFPGLGGAILDPHEKLPVINKSEEQLKGEDLLPFKKAVESGLAALMTSHALYKKLDPEKPATLSPFISKELLRNYLGFQGLLISDDLEMGAIERSQTVAEAAVAALKAGVDLLLICQEHDKVRASWKAIAKEPDLISNEQLRVALGRQMKVSEIIFSD